MEEGQVTGRKRKTNRKSDRYTYRDTERKERDTDRDSGGDIERILIPGWTDLCPSSDVCMLCLWSTDETMLLPSMRPIIIIRRSKQTHTHTNARAYTHTSTHACTVAHTRRWLLRPRGTDHRLESTPHQLQQLVYLGHNYCHLQRPSHRFFIRCRN